MKVNAFDLDLRYPIGPKFKCSTVSLASDAVFAKENHSSNDVVFQPILTYLFLRIPFCVACEAWSTHRDHVSVSFVWVVVSVVVGVVIVVRIVTLLISNR